MKIVLLEPFFTGSHQQWAEGWQRHTRHEIQLLTLPGRYWKWRMFGGAITLGRQYLEQNLKADLLVATDMLDFATFLGITRSATAGVPTALYFHENQITYPWSVHPTKKRNKGENTRENEYGFLNFTSAVAADHLLFNSRYHQKAFLEALPGFLRQFPDYKELNAVNLLSQKSSVLPLGMDLGRFDAYLGTPKTQNEVPIILWNHRWEYDKNPDAFFAALFALKAENIPFRLVVLGEQFKRTPPIFAKAKTYLANEILHWGYADDFSAYAKWLHQADVLPVTSQQDFFGGSAVEAIYCNCYPLLPKRLAFPEHLPKVLHSAHLYSTENALLEKLRQLLSSPNLLSANTNFQNLVGAYDWSNLAPLYDEQVEELTKKLK